jgi:hypothetical protein
VAREPSRNRLDQIAVKISIGMFGFTGTINVGENTSGVVLGATGACTDARPTTAPRANMAKAEKMAIFVMPIAFPAAAP